MSSSVPEHRALGPDQTQEMLKFFRGERTGWVRVGDKGWFFPHRWTEQGPGFYNFRPRKDDTWVVSYPRSGTTWTQELVWLIANNLDFETANSRLLVERFPFLEFSMFNHPDVTREFLELNEGDPEKRELCRQVAEPGYEVLDALPSPRFIKTHLPFELLPNVLGSGCKIVYVARNPKDVVVSWFKLNQAFNTQGYTGDFARFWRYFRNDLTAWSPYWEHLKQAWSHRNRENLLFLFYEEMQQNLSEVIERVSEFLGKSYTSEQVERLKEHLDIKNFRDNAMINGQELKACGIIRADSDFVRKGQSGGWKSYFTDELEAEADEWIAKNLSDTDFQFPITNNNWYQQ